MIIPYFKLVMCAFKVVTPLLKSANDTKHFLISNWVIAFFRGHRMRGECDRVPFAILFNREHCSSSIIRSICFQTEGFVIIGISQDRGSGEMFFKEIKGCLLLCLPSEGGILLSKIIQGSCDLRISFDESAIKVGKTEKTAYTSNILRDWPFLNGLNLSIIHLDAIMRYYHAKEFHFLDTEGALLVSQTGHCLQDVAILSLKFVRVHECR